jgi:hypothetical protein
VAQVPLSFAAQRAVRGTNSSQLCSLSRFPACCADAAPLSPFAQAPSAPAGWRALTGAWGVAQHPRAWPPVQSDHGWVIDDGGVLETMFGGDVPPRRHRPRHFPQQGYGDVVLTSSQRACAAHLQPRHFFLSVCFLSDACAWMCLVASPACLVVQLAFSTPALPALAAVLAQCQAKSRPERHRRAASSRETARHRALQRRRSSQQLTPVWQTCRCS